MRAAETGRGAGGARARAGRARAAAACPTAASPAHEAELAAALAPLLGPGDWCVAPFEGDGHPDHEAGGPGRARRLRDDRRRLLPYPLWAWHWAEPDDPRVPWDARRAACRCPPTALRRKRAALACYPSQTEPLGPAPEDAAVVPPARAGALPAADEVLLT